MPLATAADAPLLTNDDFIFRPMAVPSRGSAELAVWTITVPPGAASATHSVSREEVFLVSTGRLSAEIGDLVLTAGPGDALIIPPETDFHLRNPGREAAEATVITSAGITGRLGGTTISPPWAQ